MTSITRFLARVASLDGTLERTEPGLWSGTLGGFALHAVETSQRYVGQGERLLYMMSRDVLTHVGGLGEPGELSQHEMDICRMLCRHIEQLGQREDAAMIKDRQKLSKSYMEALERLLEVIPVERRLAGIDPKTLLAHFDPEQRIAGIDPKTLLAHFDPEQRVAGLDPEQRIAGLPLEEVGAALGPSALLTLPIEALRALSSDYIATLPADLRDRVAARLAAAPPPAATAPRKKTVKKTGPRQRVVKK